MTFDAAHYIHGDAFQSEKRTVFASSWLSIGVAQQLAQPGQYVSAAAGGWPMLAVRGADGVLRAFRNTCRHKQMLLADKDSGSCELFRCRFHGWTYDLSGAFVEAPTAVAPTGDHAQHGLMPMALQQWRQIMLVNLQADAAPADFSAPDNAAYTHYAGASSIDIGCNWKTLLELTLPDDHVTWCSPTLLMRMSDSALVIDQIVPRTFLRTRVNRHVYRVAAGEHAAAESTALEALKIQAEILQAVRAGGVAVDTANARVAQLHARLAQAYTQDRATL